MDLQPLGDRLIVEVLEEEETTTSGIVLPDTAKEKPQRGRVLAVGPGGRSEKGDIIPMELGFQVRRNRDQARRRRGSDPARVRRARQGHVHQEECQELEERARRRFCLTRTTEVFDGS